MIAPPGSGRSKPPVLRKVEFDELRVQGYAFQVALLHEAVSLEAKK